MLRYVFLILLLIHGVIHVLGFLKAFHISEVSQITKAVDKPSGVLWLVTAILFLTASIFYLLDNHYWSIIAILTAALSQWLIFNAWQDAKFGTLANIIIAFVAMVFYSTWSFENDFENDVSNSLDRQEQIQMDLITEKDMEHLPAQCKNTCTMWG